MSNPKACDKQESSGWVFGGGVLLLLLKKKLTLNSKEK